MISKRELDLLYGWVEAISDAKYDGHGIINEISFYGGDGFMVEYETDSYCGCCNNEIEHIDVSYEEATGDWKEIVKEIEDFKAKDKADGLKRVEEQKNKDAKAKEVRELVEFNRLSKKFKK